MSSRSETVASEILEADGAEQSWSATKRRIVSAILLFHFVSVFIAASVIPPASTSVSTMHSWVLPYLQATYMNHGFRFFAPEPGPTHIVQYEVEGETKAFPDRDAIWPRLRYHRWFMLSESMFVEADRYMQEQEIETWQREERQLIDALKADGRLQEATELQRELASRVEEQKIINQLAKELADSIRRVLLKRTGADEIKMWSATRELPSPADVMAGRSLGDPVYLPIEAQIDLTTFERGEPEQITPRSEN